MTTSVTAKKSDITEMFVDVIVNAANTGLRGGGGVDGAIHHAAGPGLRRELEIHYPARDDRGTAGITGGAYLTTGHDLPAKYVAHAIGPVYDEAAAPALRSLLAQAYQASLDRAQTVNARSVAFPAISAGVYGWPLDDAAKTAVTAIKGWLDRTAGLTSIKDVIFVLFSDEVLEAFEKAISDAGL